MHANPFPLWLKLFQTAFVAVLIPVYWVELGPENFLWFSDLALLATVIVLWSGHRLIASMAALAVVVLELGWNIDFVIELATGSTILDLASYMFDPDVKLIIKVLSGLFHILLPWLLLYFVVMLGYDRRALIGQTLVCWVVLPLSYVFTTPEQNVNWVHGFGADATGSLPDVMQLTVLFLGFPLLVYLPTHFLLIVVERASARAPGGSRP